jgi:Recombination endonuclease VII
MKRGSTPWTRRSEESRNKLAVRRKRERLAWQEQIAGRPRPQTCEVCAQTGRIVFDHDHASIRFRGWICDTCNKVLGLVKESPVVLQLLAEYIVRTTKHVARTDDGGAD